MNDNVTIITKQARSRITWLLNSYFSYYPTTEKREIMEIGRID
jgi:hypothetical protein